MEPQTMTEPDVRPTHAGRCTLCGVVSDKLRRFPFATYACPACTAKLDAQAEQEVRDGMVCYRCRQPYTRCWH